MRVLHFLHYARGGIVTVVLTQITQSTDPGIEYHLLVLEPAPDELVAEAKRRGVRLHVLDSGMMFLPWRYRALLRKLKPDVVHTHSYVPRKLTALAAMTGGGFASVSTVHNDYPYFHSRSLRSRFKCASEAFYLRVNNGLTICCSEMVRGVVAKRYRVPPARLHRIYNGIAVESTTTGAAAPPAKGPVAVTVGRVSEQKNYGLLIECWNEFSRRVPGAELWIIGDGDERAMLEERVRVLGLGTVKFWGWLPPAEVPSILQRCDVFVLSSRHEALPTSMLEAFAAGLPAVSTRVGGVGEIIEDGVSGYIVDDAAGLTRALETILVLPAAERAAMGARGRDRVLREFAAERFVREIEQTYRECVA